MKRSRSLAIKTEVTKPDSTIDRNTPKTIVIRAQRDGKAKSVAIGPGNGITLAEVRRHFPGAIQLLLKRGKKERVREPDGEIFKAPWQGWAHYDVYVRAAEVKVPSTSALLTRFNVRSFDELYSSFRFAASAEFNMTKFTEYRTGAIQVFLNLMLKLGPESFDLSTIYRISVGDPSICNALMSIVEDRRQCHICKVDFKNATMALKHFASLHHGRKCLFKFEEQQYLEAFLIRARNLSFFQSNSSRSSFPNQPNPGFDDGSDDRSSSDEEPPEKRAATLPTTTCAPTSPPAKTPAARLNKRSRAIPAMPPPDQHSNSSNEASGNPAAVKNVPFASPQVESLSIFDHFKVNGMSELCKLPTFRSLNGPQRYFKKFRWYCISSFPSFFTTVQDRNAPIMAYLFQASRRTTQLHDINIIFPTLCECKVALTMKHVFERKHIKRHPHTIINELWGIVNHIVKQNDESEAEQHSS